MEDILKCLVGAIGRDLQYQFAHVMIHTKATIRLVRSLGMIRKYDDLYKRRVACRRKGLDCYQLEALDNQSFFNYKSTLPQELGKVTLMLGDDIIMEILPIANPLSEVIELRFKKNDKIVHVEYFNPKYSLLAYIRPLYSNICTFFELDNRFDNLTIYNIFDTYSNVSVRENNYLRDRLIVCCRKSGIGISLKECLYKGLFSMNGMWRKKNGSLEFLASFYVSTIEKIGNKRRKAKVWKNFDIRTMKEIPSERIYRHPSNSFIHAVLVNANK